MDSGVTISLKLENLTILLFHIFRVYFVFSRICSDISAAFQNLAQVFTELGYEPEDCVPFSVLSRHLFIQDLMLNPAHYKLVV